MGRERCRVGRERISKMLEITIKDGRGASLIVRYGVVCAVSSQEAIILRVIFGFECGIVQGSAAEGVAEIRVCPGLKKSANDVDATELLHDVMERAFPIFIDFIRAGSGGKQDGAGLWVCHVEERGEGAPHEMDVV